MLTREQGDMDRAKFIFEHTTHIEPEESYSHIVLASLLSAEGLHQEARQRYRTALAVSDNDAASFNIQLSLATLLPRIMPGPATAVDVHLQRVQVCMYGGKLICTATRVVYGSLHMLWLGL